MFMLGQCFYDKGTSVSTDVKVLWNDWVFGKCSFYSTLPKAGEIVSDDVVIKHFGFIISAYTEIEK